MENIEIWELALIGFIIFAKFGLIIGMVYWTKSKNEKKRLQFLAEEERKKAMRQSASEI